MSPGGGEEEGSRAERKVGTSLQVVKLGVGVQVGRAGWLKQSERETGDKIKEEG